MNEQIEIQLSKSKLSILLIMSVIFVLSGLWLIINPKEISNVIIGNSTVILIVGIASVLFFGMCMVFITKKILNKTPGIIFNKTGLIDNSSGVSAGLILWTDITGISITTVANQKFLMIIVNNPDKYINRQKGFIKKKAMQMNNNWYGSPISISANGLKCNLEQLHTLLQEQYHESKNPQ